MVKLQPPVRWRHVATPVLLFTAACGDDPVETPNRAPFASAEIPDATVAAGDSAALDLTPYFSDPDDDPLTFEAVSSDASVAAASASGSSVATRGVAKGTATVTVTATDPEGLSASQDFKVAVPNRQPRVADTIPGQQLFRGDSATVGVAPYFSDPDGDALAFEATSSDASVATVSVSGSTVAILAVASGRATATVTAADPEGLSVSQDFEITVPNRSPAVTDSIADQELFRGDSARFGLTAHFADPDEDSLRFVAASSDSAVTVLSVAGATVTIRAMRQGTATATVTASDPGGLSVSQTFEVTVPNRPPRVIDSIAARELFRGDSATLDMTAHFDDPDGDALIFTAQTSDEGVVSASVSGSVMTVTGVAGGEAEITVTATDPDALSATLSAEITVIPHPDRAALVALFEAAGGPNWNRNDNWLSDEPLDRWRGVGVNREGRVIWLFMQGNNLTGRIPPEFGALTELENATLSFNRLSGAIPPELGALTKLKELDLGANDLDRPIPPELGRLSSLVELSLYQNRLPGPFPPELGGLANLEVLSLAHNRFASPIPKEFGDLSELRVLYVANAGFSSPWIKGSRGKIACAWRTRCTSGPGCAGMADLGVCGSDLRL